MSSEKGNRFHLNLRLCFLSITLTLAYMVYLVHRGTWNTASLAGVATSLLLLAVLIFFVRYPLGAIRKKTPPLTF